MGFIDFFPLSRDNDIKCEPVEIEIWGKHGKCETVEDEIHLIMFCNRFNDSRAIFIYRIKAIYVPFKIMNNLYSLYTVHIIYNLYLIVISLDNSNIS